MSIDVHSAGAEHPSATKPARVLQPQSTTSLELGSRQHWPFPIRSAKHFFPELTHSFGQHGPGEGPHIRIKRTRGPEEFVASVFLPITTPHYATKIHVVAVHIALPPIFTGAMRIPNWVRPGAIRSFPLIGRIRSSSNLSEANNDFDLVLWRSYEGIIIGGGARRLRDSELPNRRLSHSEEAQEISHAFHGRTRE